MDDCGHGRSALAILAAAGCLGPECIAVHLNEWEPDDFALVAPGGPLAGMTVVHCPLSHRYFGHRRFPVERLRDLSVNLCVGTDSQASNGSFSLLDELRVMAAATPRARPGRTPRHDHASPRPRAGSGGSAGLYSTRRVGGPDRSALPQR